MGLPAQELFPGNFSAPCRGKVCKLHLPRSLCHMLTLAPCFAGCRQFCSINCLPVTQPSYRLVNLWLLHCTWIEFCAGNLDAGLHLNTAQGGHKQAAHQGTLQAGWGAAWGAHPGDAVDVGAGTQLSFTQNNARAPPASSWVHQAASSNH